MKTVLQDSRQKSLQGSLLGSTGDTRYSLSGNYFDQGGLIPGSGLPSRLRLRLARPHGRPVARRSEREQRARLPGHRRERCGVRLRGRDAALRRRLQLHEQDSAGLYDPRPDDDQLNINPLLENRSFVRQRLTNRIFGSAFADFQIADGLSYRLAFGPDFTNTSEGCYNDPWTHGPCANPGANSQNQGAPPQAYLRNAYDFAYTLDNLVQYNKNLGTQHHFEVTGLYSSSTIASTATRSTLRTFRTTRSSGTTSGRVPRASS